MFTVCQPRRIQMCQHGKYAARILGRARVDSFDASIGDGTSHDRCISDIREIELRCVLCSASDLLRAVDAAEWFADNSVRHACPPAISIARTMARCMSSILKSLRP